MGPPLAGRGSTSFCATLGFASSKLSVGVLGEYIGRIYEQSRGTPRYVVVERDE